MQRDLRTHNRPRPWARAKRVVLVLAVLVLLVVVGAGVQMLRGVPVLTSQVVFPSHLRVPGPSAPLPWPAQAAAALEIEGMSGIEGVRTEEVRPLASVAKLVTALVVLKDYPLAIGASGPVITITAADAQAYQQAVAAGESVAAVATGERLTELQALEAMLVPSADNVAQILAVWAAGSMSAFVAQMNAEATHLGMHHTHLAGPSGLDPGSVGTAADMVLLAQAAMANPVISEVVALPQVTLPVAGTVYNYDVAIGHDGIFGVKTGSTTAAGGNFVFAARRLIDGHEVTVYGAILGATGVKPLQSALDKAEKLAAAALDEVHVVQVLAAGRPVVEVHAAWGPSAVATTERSVSFLAVPGEPLVVSVEPASVLRSKSFHEVTAGEVLGDVVIGVGSASVTVPAVATGSVPAAPASYRLERL